MRFRNIKYKTEIMVVMVTIVGLFYIKIYLKDVAIATLSVLFLTMIAIIYYTIVTWRLKNLTSKQITYAIRPIVVCEIDGSLCKIKNIGNGTALYVNIENVPTDFDKGFIKSGQVPENAECITFGEVSYLEEKSDWKRIDVKVSDENNKEYGLSENTLQFILPTIKKITLIYQDIDLAKYGTHLIRVEDRLVVKKFF